ncbi:uncharacterized protein LOC102717642 [Oryza brachyantha]|uniref:uncharacterized protein LOC102717642 n=1 Tax=Oryza brachyantha TaxID=4533 RepID=UPI001ADA0312|nr:uncharacterized protein LOC102717642 [Oryza brachyantha]
MYATKPLSLFKSHPEAASQPPSEGRGSGYLVVKGPDDDGDDDETCCWGTCGGSRVRDLPFPQNRVLTVRYTEQHGESSTTYSDAVVFVPIPDQPLASNRYYAVVATGKYKGLVRACSREEDMTTFCFCRCINDAKPRPFDPADVYQQVEIVQRRRGRFTARSVAADGFPYFLYRKKYWRVYASKSKHFDLGEAPGLNAALRSRQLAGANNFLLEAFPAATTTTSPTAVGKWYTPFFLIKETGVAPPEQMDRATFYEVSLEQRWEPVHGDGFGKLEGKRVLIGGSVEGKQEASAGERHGDGYVWFRAVAGQRVGVSASLWERMLWEEYRGGWVDEHGEAGKFAAGGSVLVERFVVKRADGSVAVAVDFVHFNKVRESQV